MVIFSTQILHWLNDGMSLVEGEWCYGKMSQTSAAQFLARIVIPQWWSSWNPKSMDTKGLQCRLTVNFVST
jgi:hypothetical protein